jgi:F-type H+-transporting ATPase subunit gamma
MGGNHGALVSTGGTLRGPGIVTRRRELEEHRHSLAEVREIMNSMKTLAYMESRKLDRFLDAQEMVVADIETVAADFLSFYPEVIPPAGAGARVYLIVGSERGFCGDFNTSLQRYVAANLPADALLILCGRKLHGLFEDDARVAHFADGASVVEEIPATLATITDVLDGLERRLGTIALYLIHHGDEETGVTMQRLLPPFQERPQDAPSHAFPPQMYLGHSQFVLQLTEQYVFAALNAGLYLSLMIENRRRVRHLEGAVRHLDEEGEELARRSNSLRQEEIIEEIEVILISRDTLAARET